MLQTVCYFKRKIESLFRDKELICAEERDEN